MATTLRTLIVDDEPLARQRLRTLLLAEADVEIVGECADGPAAVAALEADRPDLVFLDVQMPGCDGFGVIEAVGGANMPAVVFVTAYDRHALRAFEVHALDYLLKPFDRERFQKALAHARDQVRRGRAAAEVGQRLARFLEEMGPKKKPAERLVVKSAGHVVFLRVEEIDWVEAASNYVQLHVGGKTHLLRETMTNLEARLDPNRFLRIHRSALVNLDRIREIQPWFHGDSVVILRDGTQLPLGRSYRGRLQELFGK